MTVRVRQLDSLAQEMETVQQQVMTRAHQLFRERGGAWGQALDDWLTAEREVVWKPAVELTEHDGELCLEMAAAGVDAKDLDIRVTRDDVIITAPTHHRHSTSGVIHFCEFKCGSLFRSIHLPRPVDPARVRASYRNGLLKVTLPVAVKEAQRVSLGAGEVESSARERVDVEC